MIQNVLIPPELRTLIGTEPRDFVIKARRAQPLKGPIILIIFGIVWLLFTSVFFVAFLGPLFMGEDVSMLVNDQPVVAGPENPGPLIMPAIIIGIFTLVGIGLLWFGIHLVTKEGGYFAATPTRLISYRKGSATSIDWEQFSGHIEIQGTAGKGDITLQLRTGRMVSSKNGPDRYVPDAVYIAGIQDVYEVEKICRQRIKENDPTPALA